MAEKQNARRTGMLIACGFAGAVLVGTLGAVGAHEAKGHLAGLLSGNFSVSETATAADTELPKYPGATTDYENGAQNNAAQIQAMLGHSGIKLAVLTLLSKDPPAKIAAFYRGPLSRYGRVVDCTKQTERENPVCNDDKSDAAFDLRAGKKHDLHIVAIEEKASGSEITLIHMRLKGL